MSQQKCLLILDDDQEILALCQMIFKKENYRVETRSNCNNIIEDIKSVSPDLILMDLWLPKIGGEEAVKLIRKNPQYQTLPVLLFSANDEIEKKTKNSGASGFVQKPFDLNDFKKEIEKWIYE